MTHFSTPWLLTWWPTSLPLLYLRGDPLLHPLITNVMTHFSTPWLLTWWHTSLPLDYSRDDTLLHPLITHMMTHFSTPPLLTWWSTSPPSSMQEYGGRFQSLVISCGFIHLHTYISDINNTIWFITLKQQQQKQQQWQQQQRNSMWLDHENGNAMARLCFYQVFYLFCSLLILLVQIFILYCFVRNCVCFVIPVFA